MFTRLTVSDEEESRAGRLSKIALIGSVPHLCPASGRQQRDPVGVISTDHAGIEGILLDKVASAESASAATTGATVDSMSCQTAAGEVVG